MSYVQQKIIVFYGFVLIFYNIILKQVRCFVQQSPYQISDSQSFMPDISLEVKWSKVLAQRTPTFQFVRIMSRKMGMKKTMNEWMQLQINMTVILLLMQALEVVSILTWHVPFYTLPISCIFDVILLNWSRKSSWIISLF